MSVSRIGSATHGIQSFGSSTLSVTAPTGAVAGTDLILAFGFDGDTRTYPTTPPAGFTEIFGTRVGGDFEVDFDTGYMQAWWAVHNGDAAYTFTNIGNDANIVAMAAYRGVYLAEPIGSYVYSGDIASPGINVPSAGTISVPSLTPAFLGGAWVGVYGLFQATFGSSSPQTVTWTSPGGSTKIKETNQDHRSACMIAELLDVSAATGAMSTDWTTSYETKNTGGLGVLLNSAVAGTLTDRPDKQFRYPYTWDQVMRAS